MDIRQFFFKSRSYTPIPIVCLIIYFSEQSTTYLIFGVLLISFGELIRINAVRYAGGATRTRSVGAPFLCTSGPYSYTRNPLYCGNVIIYLGFVFFSGGIFMWEISILTILFFVFQYYHIISLEEETKVDYKVTNYWSKEHERSLLWSDKDINIKICDFGTSHYTKDKCDYSIGTIDYSAPECIIGLPYGKGIDIATDSSGNVFITGTPASLDEQTMEGEGTFYLMKYNSDGVKQ